MHTLLITITTAQRSIDLAVPAEVPIEKLILKLVNLCGPQSLNTAQAQPSQWHLRLIDAATPLRPTQSLLDAGITDGAILVLQNRASPILPSQQKREEQQPFTPENILPNPETGGIGVRWNTKGQ